MGKHIDELGSYQDFRAPWETESGEETDPNKNQLKKLLFNARSAKAAALDERDEFKAKVAEVEKDLESAKAEAASANGEEAQKKIDSLQSKVESLQGEIDKRDAAAEAEALRKEVLGDFAEKHPKAAKYVKGDTQEELEASLEAVKEDFGISDDDDSADGGDEEQSVGRTRPVSRLQSPIDRKGVGGEQEYDFDKVAEQAIVGSGNVFSVG